MKINKTGLCLAIAAALGSTNAYSAVAVTYIPGVRIVPAPGVTADKPVYFAKERTLETAGVFVNACRADGKGSAAALSTDIVTVVGCPDGGDLNITIPTNPGYSVNATNTMFLKINLLKGAKFGSTVDPVLKCWGSAAAAGTALLGAFQVGGKGTSSVSFSLPQNFKTTGSAGICTLIASSYVGVPSSGLSVSATVVYKDGALTKSASYKGTVISFATGTQLQVLTAGSQVTADVGKESKLFAATTRVKAGAGASQGKTAYLGFVKYGKATAIANKGVYRVATAGYKPYTVSAAAFGLSSASLVIDGASLAAASKLYLTTGAAGCGAGHVKLRSAAGNGTTTITFAKMGSNKSSFIGLSAGLNICMEVDGTKSIDQSVITASLGSVVGRTNYKPIVTPLNGATNLATIKQNGTTVRLLNVNSPAMAEKSYVRLYNTGNQAVKVIGSLFTTDGKQVGTNQVIDAALAGLSVKVLDAAALKTLFGDWTGKAMLRLDANSSTFKAMGTIRDATGTLINASGSTKN